MRAEVTDSGEGMAGNAFSFFRISSMCMVGPNSYLDRCSLNREIGCGSITPENAENLSPRCNSSHDTSPAQPEFYFLDYVHIAKLEITYLKNTMQREIVSGLVMICELPGPLFVLTQR